MQIRRCPTNSLLIWGVCIALPDSLIFRARTGVMRALSPLTVLKPVSMDMTGQPMLTRAVLEMSKTTPCFRKFHLLQLTLDSFD